MAMARKSNPDLALVTAAAASYDALGKFAAMGGNVELAEAYDAVRDAIQTFGETQIEDVVSLMSGTLSPADFCDECGEQLEETLGEARHYDDPKLIASMRDQANALNRAAKMFATLSR